MIGELAALVAVLGYTTMCTIFVDVVKLGTPLLLNFLRGVVCVIGTYAVLLLFSDSVIPYAPSRVFVLLTISGALGIGLGDSFYFKALKLLGARKAIILETLAPPFTGIAAYLYYGTTISLGGWLGMFVTAFGIFIVVGQGKEDTSAKKEPEETTSSSIQIPLLEFSIEQKELQLTSLPQSITTATTTAATLKSEEPSFLERTIGKEAEGVLYGTLFTICQAMSIVLLHDGQSSGEFSPLQTSFYRNLIGTITVALMILGQNQPLFLWPWKKTSDNQKFFTGVFFGPFLGNWGQSVAIANTRPEITQTIFAISPLIGLLLTWYKGETVKNKDIIGSLVSICGVFIVVWY